MLGRYNDERTQDGQVQWMLSALPDLQPAERGWEVVGKPEVIGWAIDPNATHEEQQHAALYEFGVDENGYFLKRRHGDTRLYKRVEDWGVWMRWLGMKRVYKPREFHAGAHGAGYLVHCKTCGTNFVTTMLPHDAAKLHATLHPEKTHHYSTSWPVDLVE